MTREDVLRFAHLSKITNPDDGQIKFGQPTAKCLEQFANLVAEAEREACAKVCENLGAYGKDVAIQKATLSDAASAIRARRIEDDCDTESN